MKKHAEKAGREARPAFFFRPLRLHPLFVAVGVWYALSGDLFLFLLSTLVALEHECAHAFAAEKLGYKLNAVILMPFGAVIDGDLRDISLKDEIFVALCGPLCNLVTAIFFVALWWFFPAAYPFTDTAFYASLAIALVNLLPAYPLDGGRILRCSLTRLFLKNSPNAAKAEKRAERVCRAVTLIFAALLLSLFFLFVFQNRLHFTLLAFGLFLLFGGLGNRTPASYEKMNFAFSPDLKKGVEIRRVAISAESKVKDCFPFLSKGSYLVLEVYEGEKLLFSLSQNELAALFLHASPYERLKNLQKTGQKV